MRVKWKTARIKKTPEEKNEMLGNAIAGVIGVIVLIALRFLIFASQPFGL